MFLSIVPFLYSKHTAAGDPSSRLSCLVINSLTSGKSERFVAVTITPLVELPFRFRFRVPVLACGEEREAARAKKTVLCYKRHTQKTSAEALVVRYWHGVEVQAPSVRPKGLSAHMRNSSPPARHHLPDLVGGFPRRL